MEGYCASLRPNYLINPYAHKNMEGKWEGPPPGWPEKLGILTKREKRPNLLTPYISRLTSHVTSHANPERPNRPTPP